MSQAEAAVYSLSPWIADYTVNGRIGTRQGNRSQPLLAARSLPVHGRRPLGRDRMCG